MSTQRELNNNCASKNNPVFLSWTKTDKEAVSPILDEKGQYFHLYARHLIEDETGGSLIYDTGITPIIPEGFRLVLESAEKFADYDLVPYASSIWPGKNLNIIFRIRLLPEGLMPPNPYEEQVYLGICYLVPVVVMQALEEGVPYSARQMAKDAISAGMKAVSGLFKFNKDHN